MEELAVELFMIKTTDTFLCLTIFMFFVFLCCQAQRSLNHAKAELCSIFNFSSHSHLPTHPGNYQERKIKLSMKIKFICLYEFSPKLFLNLTPNTKHEQRAGKI